MNELANSFRRADWPLLAAVFLLIGIGLLEIHSFAPDLFWRQVVWAGLAVFSFALFMLADYRIFRNHGGFLALLYVATLISLGGLLIFAPTTRGVQGWFRVGSASIQPVELAKLVLVLILAKYFSQRHVEIARVRNLIISGVYALLIVGLVMLQPDLGSAIILISIWVAMILFAGIRFRHIAVFALLGLAVASLAWISVIKPYQKERITSFLDPYADPRGAGYNTIQAMIAAGSGRIAGEGIGFGTQSHLGFLPQAESDFIFAAFAQETGFVGAIILLLLFGVIFWRFIRIGRQSEDNFSKLFVLGFGAYLFSEAFIHIAINLGMLPVTGIVLPFVSYGGSSLITILAGIGIIESIHINARHELRAIEIG